MQQRCKDKYCKILVQCSKFIYIYIVNVETITLKPQKMLSTSKIYPVETQYPIKKVTIIYFFNHSKMGFSNEITVDAISNDHALDAAKTEVAGCYGSKMLPRFTFKLKATA